MRVFAIVLILAGVVGFLAAYCSPIEALFVAEGSYVNDTVRVGEIAEPNLTLAENRRDGLHLASVAFLAGLILWRKK